MKILAYILATLAVGAVALTIVVNVYSHTPDNTKARELQQKDIAAERKAIDDFQRSHQNPFKAD